MATGILAILYLPACGSSKTGAPSGLKNRVMVSQEVQAAALFGHLVILNGEYDVLTSIPPIIAGNTPGLMAISPDRNIIAAFDSSSNSIFAASSTTEKSFGNQVHLAGPTNSMTMPTPDPVVYAAVPTANIPGFSLLGGVQVTNVSLGAVTTTISVPNAQTVVSNTTGSQLLVFSNDSNSVTLIAPTRALSPVDCTPSSAIQTPPTCISVAGFDRPVYAAINGSTAYVLNCGAECGGTQASVQTLDLNTLAVGTPVPVNGATWGFLSGTKLYVAGNGSPNGPRCASLTASINPTTAATFCGTLDIVDLTTMTDPYFNSPATEIAIPDGYHDRMDMSINGQLFVGSKNCTNIGDVNFPSGEVRGCLAIFNTNTGGLVIPPDNGDVDGLQSFTSRYVEYVAEGGNLRVYDTTINALLINQFVPQGTIDVVGYVGDVKAIDFF